MGDHYSLYKEDFRIAKDLAHNTHRFGIEWSRVQKDPHSWDEKEWDHYKNVVNELISLGITPMPTLNHFTIPAWVENTGGWSNSDTIELFADFAVKAIKESAVDFVIVCGDLTKDGEALSHRQLARQMASLADGGIPVYVVPGNHDILNSQSNHYQDGRIERVPTVTPREFMEIYENLGYSEALYKDPFSLSYIIEPIPGLWLFALDSCRYQENRIGKKSVTDGKFYTETLVWIEEKLIEAMVENKAVMGFFHHGALEHYIGNQLHYGDYLLEDYQFISEMLAAYGMRFVFSGHYHAQDITKKQWDTDIPNHFLLDIETGSLVTYPAPWRQVEISSQQMRLTSHYIEAVGSRPYDFPAFAAKFLREGALSLTRKILTLLNVPEEDQDLISPQVVAAYITHLAGDERLPGHPRINLSGVSPMGRLVALIQGNLIKSWYHDLAPGDNDLVIDMETGHTLANQASRSP